MAVINYNIPSNKQLEAIRINVQLAIDIVSKLCGTAIGLSRDGIVEWEQYISSLRRSKDSVGPDKLVQVVGSYLGAVLISEIGGRWIVDLEYGLGVELKASKVAFPFSKIAKFFENGREDSIVSFFDVSVHISTDDQT